MEASDDQDLYSRWLNNELTPEENTRLEESGDAEILRSIIARTDALRLPDPHADTYTRVRERIARLQQEKAIPLYRRPSFLAVAASLALLLGLFWLYRYTSSPGAMQPSPVVVAGNSGGIRSVTLPDQTGIVLYGSSTVEYDRGTFGNNRVLKLEGEAFFDVRRKGAFEVVLPAGKINVTGTQFNVLANDSVTAVRCYEGRVEVTAGGKMTVLTAGQGVRVVDHAVSSFAFDPADNDPNSTSVTVENITLEEVCVSLSVQYGVTFKPGSVDLGRSFTGTIRKDDLQTALALIFEPMQINYVIRGNEILLENR
jgi:transmembrane sensor